MICSGVTGAKKVFRAWCCPGFLGLLHHNFRFFVLLPLCRLPLLASWLPPHCKFIPPAAILDNRMGVRDSWCGQYCSLYGLHTAIAGIRTHSPHKERPYTVIQFRNIYSRNPLAPAFLPNLKYNFPKQKYKNLKK